MSRYLGYQYYTAFIEVKGKITHIHFLASQISLNFLRHKSIYRFKQKKNVYSVKKSREKKKKKKKYLPSAILRNVNIRDFFFFLA